ncbi:MAG: hypothetical protein ACXAC5_24895 [Promethearchaeota archaeon]
MSEKVLSVDRASINVKTVGGYGKVVLQLLCVEVVFNHLVFPYVR